MGFFSFLNKKNNKNQPEHSGHLPDTTKTTRAKELVAVLEEYGYFKYAEPGVTEDMRIEAARTILNGTLPFIYIETPHYRYLDLRYFQLDGETLFEQGGIIDQLKTMEPVFQKMGVAMNITDHLEEWDEENNWLNHEITINGRKYILFHHYEGYGWGEAAQRFADMVNDQLEQQGSSERLYLSEGGNDGQSILLNEQLFRLLRDHIQTSARPLTVEEWCPAMQVTREKI